LETLYAIMIEDILKHTSPFNIGVAFLGIFVLAVVTGWIREELKIRALGGHAPKIRTWLPWGK
jgi:hypothetical protein